MENVCRADTRAITVDGAIVSLSCVEIVLPGKPRQERKEKST